jgi:hypothetical protein
MTRPETQRKSWASESQLHVLASPVFIVSLLLLLINDFFLKQQFHNELTGKLSDFAGLFVFPLFWYAFFPLLRIHIYILTAISFVFWKSAYSQILIDGWNSLPLFSIGRTVDYTDLLALTILPLSYAYGYVRFKAQLPKPALCLIAVVSLFAFTATQYSTWVEYSQEYQFQYSKKELMERMSKLPIDEPFPSFWNCRDTFEITFVEMCRGRGVIAIEEANNHSVITLRKMEDTCPQPDKEEILEYFEEVFIESLRKDRVRKTHRIGWINCSSPKDPISNTPGNIDSGDETNPH